MSYNIFQDRIMMQALLVILPAIFFILGFVFALVVADMLPEIFNMMLTNYVDEIAGGM